MTARRLAVWARIRSFTRRYGAWLWFAVLALCAGVFSVRGRADFARALDVLAGSSPLWIALILAIQASALALGAWSYQLVLRRCRGEVGLRRLLAIQLDRKVVSTLMLAGGPASVYVFVRGVEKDGIAGQDALLTIGLRSLLGYTSFVALLLPAVLLARPEGVYMAGALGVLAVFATLAGSAALLLRHPRPARWVARRAPQRVAALLAHARSHHIRPVGLRAPFLLAVIGQLANVATLVGALYALGYAAAPVPILAAYTAGTAVQTMAPLFQGVGIVEVSMAVTLQQFGVPADVAIGATLIYRGATVWFPLLLGLLHQAGRRLTGRGWWPVCRAALRPPVTLRRALFVAMMLVGLLAVLTSAATPPPQGQQPPESRGVRAYMTAR